MWFSSSWGKRQRSAPSGRRSPGKRTSFRPRLEALEDRWLPSQVTLTVTSLADAGAGSLRDAIQQADADNPSDKITINTAVTGTIDLFSPLPHLDNNIAIQGPGASSLTVERADGHKINTPMIFVDPGQTASLSGLTIANCNFFAIANSGTLTLSDCIVSGNSNAGAIINDDAGTLTVSGCTLSGNSSAIGAAGGGITNYGTATVTGSILSGNSAPFGGGIQNHGPLTVRDSLFTGNSADEGGGIANLYSTATVTGSTLCGNSALFLGGALWNNNVATLVLSGSTVDSNHAPNGGGIQNLGSLTVSNGSIISNNSAQFGGGISNDSVESASVTVRDSVLCGNSAFQGGAIYNYSVDTLVVRGSTLSGNTASDSGGAVYNSGTATIQQSTLSGNGAGADGGAFFNDASGTLVLKESTVLNNVAPLGADLYNLGALTLDDSTVGVLGP
jgi:hypothetical protein